MIGRIIGALFVSYIAIAVLFSVIMLLVMIVMEIIYPNTKEPGPPNVFGLHYYARADKKEEDRKKEEITYKIFKILGGICVLLAIGLSIFLVASGIV